MSFNVQHCVASIISAVCCNTFSPRAGRRFGPFASSTISNRVAPSDGLASEAIMEINYAESDEVCSSHCEGGTVTHTVESAFAFESHEAGGRL